MRERREEGGENEREEGGRNEREEEGRNEREEGGERGEIDFQNTCGLILVQ